MSWNIFSICPHARHTGYARGSSSAAIFSNYLDPEDYETEEEYEEAFNEAKYGWRDDYSIYDNNKGIDSEDYEAEDEYLEALEEDS